MPTDLFQKFKVTLCKYCMDEINDVMPSKIGIIATGNANKCTNKQEDALYYVHTGNIEGVESHAQK